MIDGRPPFWEAEVRVSMAARLAVGLVAALWALGLGRADAGWIAADWRGHEPQYRPGSYMWSEGNVTRYPVVYRREFGVPKGVRYAVVAVRSHWWWYGYLNGELFGWYEQKGEGRVTNERTVDVTRFLKPGRNAILISAPADGFSVEGWVVYADGSRSRLRSDTTWRVSKLPALTMLDWSQETKPGFNDSAWFSTASTDGPAVGGDASALIERARSEEWPTLLAQMVWRLDLLVRKGIVVHNWEAYGWGGAARIDPVVVRAAEDLLKLARADQRMASSGILRESLTGRPLVDAVEALTLYVRLSDAVANLANHAQYWRSIGRPDLGTLAEGAAKRAATACGAAIRCIKRGEAQRALPGLGAAWAAAESARSALGKRWGNRLNEYSSAFMNKVSWVDNTQMLDNDPDAWGVRVNPVEVDWKIDLAGKWRFKTDPDNIGLRDNWQSFAFNVEGQWQELTVPGSWEKQGIQMANPNAPADNPYKVNVRTDGPYNGYAFYRKTLRVPKEWAGNDLEFFVTNMDDWDWVYWNGEKIGETTYETNPKDWWTANRRYKIPASKVNFGGINTIAVRIYDCGAEGGMYGQVELRCPGLRAAYESKPRSNQPQTEVFCSPLSVGALLTPGGTALTLWGWDARASAGPTRLLLPVGGKIRSIPLTGGGVAYDRARDGRLSENWAVLWMDSVKGELDKPIQLVLTAEPRVIRAKTTDRGVSEVTIQFDNPRARVVAVRPVREPATLGQGGVPSVSCIARFRFWSRALLAYPVGYTEIVQRDRDDRWRLRVVDVYNYRALQSAWGTQPLRVAPLPPLACYAAKVKMRRFSLNSPATDLGYTMDIWGPLLAVPNRTQVAYAVPISPLRRMAGYTSFCFGPTDVGGKGNDKECEAISLVGGTSYRPQHNQHGDAAMAMVGYCRKHGINNTFNADGRLGGSLDAVPHYVELARRCKDLPEDLISYDLINEPADITPEVYNPIIATLTREIRKIDAVHPIYVETPHSYASVTQFVNLKATGDPKTIYAFHDYDYRLPGYWPNATTDLRNIVAQWLPALKFSIDNNAPIGVTEFGGFEQTKNDPWNNPCGYTMMMDLFRMFDQFGWHYHYYSNRGTMGVREDGAFRLSQVERAFRKHADRGLVDYYYGPLKVR